MYSKNEPYRVRFLNFWKSFDPHENFFIDLIQSSGKYAEIVSNRYAPVDLEIVGNFNSRAKIVLTKGLRRVIGLSNQPSHNNRVENLGIPKRTRNTRRRIWYTGENTRVPYGADFDGYLSFDSSDERLGNAYLPLWMLSVGWFGNSRDARRVGLKSNAEQLLKIRIPEFQKTKLLCAFVGNPEPSRLRSLERLGQHLEIEKFGMYFGRYVNDKYSVAKQFKFSIAYENDLYPGYVTEKIVESFLTGTIPIYKGLFNLEGESIFNKKAFFNALDYETDVELARKLLDFTDEEYLKMYSEPLLRALPSMTKIQSVILGDS